MLSVYDILYEKKRGGLMEDKEKDFQSIEDYSDQVSVIKDVIGKLSSIIDEHEELKGMNFGLFHQHGRLAFVDLDHFADKVKVKLDEDSEEKTLTELKKEIDKNEE